VGGYEIFLGPAVVLLLNFACVVTDPELGLCAASGHSCTVGYFIEQWEKVMRNGRMSLMEV